MFHYYHPTPVPSPYHSSYPNYSDYSDYIMAERRALAYRQQQRREQEEALYRQRLQREREREHRAQVLAYQAALEAQEEERRYAQFLAHKREQQRRQQLEAENEAQAQYFHRAQQPFAHEDVVGESAPFEHLLSSLFSTHATPTAWSSSPASSVATSEDTAVSAPSSAPVEVEETSVVPEVETASTPVASTSQADVEFAATTLQRHFRAHQQRRQKLRSISTLSTSLDTRKAELTLPTTLAFQPSPPSSSMDDVSSISSDATPKLAYSSINGPFLAYEDFLIGLLTKIDAIETGGDRVVKKARKELVKQVERELSFLDTKKDADWRRTSAEAVEVEDTVAAEEEEEAAAVRDSLVVSESDPSLAAPHTSVTSSDPHTFNTKSDNPRLVDQLATPTPITASSLEFVPSAEKPNRDRSSSASTSSEATLADVEEAVNFVLRAAAKLGEQVLSQENVEPTTNLGVEGVHLVV